VIPARMQSSRLPGKPLIEIFRKTVLQRTWERCIEAFSEQSVYVATDDSRIQEHCNIIGMNCVMTSKNCLTGTDRVAEVAQKVEADTYINVQGDEPLMNPQDIISVSQAAIKYPDEIINGYGPITDENQFRSLNVPKVVLRPDSRLLYMSRSPIPGNKARDFIKGYRQICIYAFPAVSLKQFTKQKTKTPLEKIEDIEILRFLELGFDVRMVELSTESISVDTPEDVKKVKLVLKK
jgi:3-deoxy-manno-octulosonate cytidylyltransferase (CMP-KDO synthetase)